MSDVVGGVEWVVKDFKKNGKKKSVASMSLGGGRSQTLNRAVAAAAKAGVHFIVAAGNDYADACDYSPSVVDLAIKVGSRIIPGKNIVQILNENGFTINKNKTSNIFFIAIN